MHASQTTDYTVTKDTCEGEGGERRGREGVGEEEKEEGERELN